MQPYQGLTWERAGEGGRKGEKEESGLGEEEEKGDGNRGVEGEESKS